MKLTWCVLFGHKITKRVKSNSMFFADNLYCCRCEFWSYDHESFEWFKRWGNGIIPDARGHLRGLYIDVTGRLYSIWYPIKVKLFGEDLPF